jgi:hypothetical protein
VVGISPWLAPQSIRKPTIEILDRRLSTFTDLSRDVSFQDRASFLDQIAEVVADNPWGHGLGATGVSSQLMAGGSGIRDFDNGVFAVLYSLGWVAGSGLLLAALAVVLQLFRRTAGRPDPLVGAGRAIGAAVLAMSLGSNVFEGATAAVFWCFAGLTIASLRFGRGGAEPR